MSHPFHASTAPRDRYLPSIPDDEYHADRSAVSSSALKLLHQRSPAHARTALDAAPVETAALTLGRAVHCRVLEPKHFASTHVVAPVCDRRTRDGKAVWAAFIEANTGKTILSAADAAVIEGIGANVHAHPLAHELLTDGEAELTGVFVDLETGVLVKTRPDYFHVADNVIVDLKTTIDASSRAFSRAVVNYGYALQAALYSACFEAITGKPLDDFIFIAVEKTPPYAVAVYRLDESAMRVGEMQYRAALRKWAECTASGSWPSYEPHIQSISLPAWAMNDYEIEMELAA